MRFLESTQAEGRGSKILYKKQDFFQFCGVLVDGRIMAHSAQAGLSANLSPGKVDSWARK